MLAGGEGGLVETGPTILPAMSLHYHSNSCQTFTVIILSCSLPRSTVCAELPNCVMNPPCIYCCVVSVLYNILVFSCVSVLCILVFLSNRLRKDETAGGQSMAAAM